MSMYGCASGFTIPSSGFPFGYVVYRWTPGNPGQWDRAVSTCTTEIPGPPTRQGEFENECVLIQCQSRVQAKPR